MIDLLLTVPAVPIAQPRAKAVTVAGRTRMYTPTTRKTTDGIRHAAGDEQPRVEIRVRDQLAVEFDGLTGCRAEQPLLEGVG